MNDLISRRQAIDALDFEIVHMTAYCDGKNEGNPLAQYNKGLEDGKKTIEALPSARINLNERIKVKLTDYGKEIYYHRFDDVFRQTELSVFKPEFPKTDEEGYTTFQLWDFIHIYGNYIDMGLPTVIEPLEIVYVGD